MCDPLAIIGGMASMAGQVVQAQQQQAYVDAQNAANRQAAELSRQARMRELERQKAFEQENIEKWDESREYLTRDQQDARKDDAQQATLDEIDTRPNSNDGMMLSGQDTAAPEFQQALVRATSERAADTRKRVESLARLGAYGQVGSGNTINLGAVNDQLNTTQGLRRGSLGVADFEQQVPAAVVSRGSSALGDILSGVGGIVGGMGGGGGGFGGGGVTTIPKGRIY